jgi:hypothetical protein
MTDAAFSLQNPTARLICGDARRRSGFNREILNPDAIEEKIARLMALRATGKPTLVVYGNETPTRSRAEIESMAALPNIQIERLPKGKLSLHEDFRTKSFLSSDRFFSRKQALSARLCPLAEATIWPLSDRISWREYTVVYRASLSN